MFKSLLTQIIGIEYKEAVGLVREIIEFIYSNENIGKKKDWVVVDVNPNREILEQHAEGLICLSACIQGEVARHILDGNKDNVSVYYGLDIGLANTGLNEAYNAQYIDHKVIERDGSYVVLSKQNQGRPLLLESGCRLAEPGEFTKRAFLNGRIDLSQAEAIIDIINANDEYNVYSGENQLKGKLSEKINSIRESLINYLY